MFYLTLAVIVPLIVVLVVFPWLGEWDILFTTVKEGTVKTVMSGKSVHHFLMSFAGYHLNNPSKGWFTTENGAEAWDIISHKGEDDDKYDDRSWLLKYLGLYWVGWPWRANVYVYKFEWNETKTDIATGKEEVRSRTEYTDFIFVSDFTYAVVTDAAETSEGLPTDELTLVTVAICNPYRALFSGEDWMRRITSVVNRHVREFVGNQEYQHLISTKIDKVSFAKPIIKLNDKLPDDPAKKSLGLKKRYGVTIRTADLQTIVLSGAAKKEHEEASTAKYTAERKAEAVKAEAEADAAATRMRGNAAADVIAITGNKEAEALRARLSVIREHGDAGITLAGYDAIQNASKNAGSQIIWANNPLGALAGLLKPEKKGDGS